MKIANISVDRPIAITMVMLISIVLGITMLFRIPIDLFPDMEMPVVTVTTKYFGASPQEIENQITKVLEDEFSSLENIDTISSTSSQDVSTIMVQFKWGTALDIAAIDVKEKVDKVKHKLPSDLPSDPIIQKLDPTATPILQYSLSAEHSLGELYLLADKNIKPRLEKIKGVSNIEIVGGRVNEVKVYLNPDKMKHYGLAVPAVMETLSKDTRNYALGKIDQGTRELSIKTKGEITDLSQLEFLSFSTPSGGRVYLKDFAEIKMEYGETSEQTYFNGEQALGIFIYKQKDANTVELSKLINEEMDQISNELLENEIDTTKIIDSADFINASIKNLVKDGLIGATLAVIILYLFLGRISSTLVVAIAIPITIVTTFAVMYFAGITINLITLGALGIGIGMMVDDAVVVMQNIYRHYHEEKRNIIDAAKIGTKEVGSAVVASTITRVIVFLPMMFVDGLAAQIFLPLALVVSIALTSSLLVGLTITPMLSSVLLKQEGKEKWMVLLKPLEKASLFIQKYITKLEDKYRRLLNWSIDHRKTVISIALITFILGVSFVPFVGGEFLPKMDSGEFTIEVEMPSGTQVEETDKVVTDIMSELSKNPDVDMFFVTMGTNKNTNVQVDLPDYAIIDVTLKDKGEREKSTSELVNELSKEFNIYPGVDIKVQEKGFVVSSLFSSDPVYITIKGTDQEKLKELTDEVYQIVKAVPGIRDPKTSYGEGQPEAQINFNGEKLKDYGLDIFNVSKTIRTAVNGEVIGVYRSNGEEIDIRLQYNPNLRRNVNDLSQIYIFAPRIGGQIPLSDIAEIKEVQGPTTIYREDKVRMAYVTSAIFGRDLQSVNTDIMDKVNELDVAEGYSIEFGGESKDMKESFSDLGFAFILAVVLIYMVMAAEFESIKHPFVIMFTLPLTFFGVTSSLALTGRALSVPSILGMIMLVGIVVSNGIVLIEYTNQLRKTGMTVKEALLKSGPTRLHPILMTTLTTVLGLIPLALGIGEGAETHAPMATVVVGGLTVSTLLTLIVIPVIYSIVEKDKLEGRFHDQFDANRTTNATS